MWDVPACSVSQRIAVVDMDPLRAFLPVFLVVTNQDKPCQQVKKMTTTHKIIKKKRHKINKLECSIIRFRSNWVNPIGHDL